MRLGHLRADHLVFSNSWIAEFKRMSPKASKLRETHKLRETEKISFVLAVDWASVFSGQGVCTLDGSLGEFSLEFPISN
jgi:hypothetical protein